ncbi:hypothetical protein [Endozoicomonas sp. GU-1]|uniref:hypothetical protein n=1 Tax=Endozoicomonas sp. GU-1 TaxID=3009078 RepID=UPI0022B454E1|nr:hypothetical protein [Endozoicomonas sp. GU-1]WBA83438.1 hypothetical protein O2T12_10075 [Endozoicomonas sp. GU-1]WBA86370.1 hypothetical protein O3276_24745 [Endozoicomonas sp. GU-1]
MPVKKTRSGLLSGLLCSMAIISTAPNTHASVMSDSKNLTVSVVIPPRLTARVLAPHQSSPADYSLCISGKGVAQFRIQSNDRSADHHLSGYSSPYPVNTSQAESCTRETANIISLPTASGHRRVMLAAE